MLLDRKYPFESTNITVESFPLNLTYSPGEKELTTPICTFEPVSQRRDADRFGELVIIQPIRSAELCSGA